MGNTKRKIALVGIGKIARDQHIPAIAEGGHFTLVATASRNASVDGVESFRDLASLLSARPDIDCISLATPPQFRFDDACRALLAGRHVMLEKPPGATLSEVQTLADIAHRKGVTLFATWHSRHAAGVEAARNWLADKTILRVEIVWKEDVRRWHPGQEWVWQAGGLGVFDPGINALSMLAAIFPRPLHLRSAELAFPANRDTPIAADLEFHDAAGAVVTAAFDWRQEGPQTWDIRVACQEGEILLSQGGARFAVDGREIAAGADREYAGLYAHFDELLGKSASDVDLRPMTHVADAFLLGRRLVVEPFEF
jgi:D-galactose 1-dehydrogenase